MPMYSIDELYFSLIVLIFCPSADLLELYAEIMHAYQLATFELRRKTTRNMSLETVIHDLRGSHF